MFVRVREAEAVGQSESEEERRRRPAGGPGAATAAVARRRRRASKRVAESNGSDAGDGCGGAETAQRERARRAGDAG